MYKYSIEENLKKVLKKLFKKDRKRYEIVMKKIEEILACGNPHHYKSLRYDLKRFRIVPKLPFGYAIAEKLCF